MPEGTFNVSRLIAELGLQNLTGQELRVLQTIQPVLNVGDIGDNSPPHVSPAAMFGGLAIGSGGNVGSVQLQCLAPGGGFIEWLTFESATTDFNMSVRTVPSGTATVLAPAGVLSRDPIASIVTTDFVAPLGAPQIQLSQDTNQYTFTPRPLFVPRGSFFLLQAQTGGGGALFLFGFGWREVPASEHVPS